MPLQNAPVVPSWRELTEAERDALVLFWQATPDDGPLPLRERALTAIDTTAAALPLEDVLWNGVGVAGLIYGPHVVQPGRLPPDAGADLLEIGIAGMAGNVPELLSYVGLDPLSLVRFGYLSIKPWRRADLRDIPRDRLMAIRETHENWAAEARPAMRRAATAFIDWVARMRTAQAAEPLLRKRHRWVFNHLSNTVPNLTSPSATQEAVRQEVRGRGRSDLCLYDDDVHDVIAAYWTRDWSQSRTEPKLGIFLGNDQNWHLDATHVVDNAVVGPNRERAEKCSSDLIEPRTLDVAAVTDSADDPAVVAEERDHRDRVRRILFAAAADDLDRQNLDLLFSGVANRSERARRLGRHENALRHRQAKLAQRALPATPASMKEAVRQILAA